jgi:hypothetical protein
VSEIDDLPLTEYLLLDVLAARFRTGDQMWTFPRRARHYLRRLEERGLVELKAGVVENTVQAWLTESGREAVLLDGYRSAFDQALDETDGLLHEWMDWWSEDCSAPVKMPNALHVRTAMYLRVRKLTRESTEERS